LCGGSDLRRRSSPSSTAQSAAPMAARGGVGVRSSQNGWND